MVSGVVIPDRESFRSLATRYTVVPVTRRLLADAETPVGVYRKLGGGPGTFLLESAEHGRSWSRYSFVGVRSAATLTERDGMAVWTDGSPPPGVPETGEPFAVLRAAEAALSSPRYPGDPPLLGGLVGYLSYDIVRRLERIGEHAVDDLGLAELRLLLCTDLAVLDHDDGSCLLVANAFTPGAHPAASWEAIDTAYDEAVCRLDAMTADLAKPSPPTVAFLNGSVTAVVGTDAVPRSRTEPGGFQRAVRAAIEEIRAGEAFQIVVSQRFETSTGASPLDVYRVLRSSNPSPYLYLLRFHDHDVVGSSPESHVTVTGRRARLHPLAGTRPRGTTPEDDARLAAELLADPKERAEHVMLVDLGRNDLGRVCTPGSVTVVEFGAVERYSHVMHIVSTVVGDVAEGHDALDVLAATFPAGTLTGAPKPRAMQIIDDLEPTRRGLYGGVVGYLDFGGDLDTAIAIRTAVLRDGHAYVQAGAGIVADSDPDTEYQESVNKATVVLRAISLAGTLRPAGPGGEDATVDEFARTAGEPA
jgi:anthranilate synthase component I